jgi:hypothetical protein
MKTASAALPASPRESVCQMVELSATAESEPAEKQDKDDDDEQ